MDHLEKISDIFGMYHDGGIIAYKGTNSFLRLTIQCDYLAEVIQPNYHFFYIDLFNIEKFELEAWPRDREQPVFVLHGYKEALKAELEIMSAEVKDNCIKVYCRQDDDSFNYEGGNLNIVCNDAKIYDQELNELSVDEMEAVCRKYWDKFK